MVKITTKPIYRILTGHAVSFIMYSIQVIKIQVVIMLNYKLVFLGKHVIFRIYSTKNHPNIILYNCKQASAKSSVSALPEIFTCAKYYTCMQHHTLIRGLLKKSSELSQRLPTFHLKCIWVWIQHCLILFYSGDEFQCYGECPCAAPTDSWSAPCPCDPYEYDPVCTADGEQISSKCLAICL